MKKLTKEEWEGVKDRFENSELCKRITTTEMYAINHGFPEWKGDDILSFFEKEVMEDTETLGDEMVECQWENCSGGRYCEKHSLESQPESS